MINEAEREKRRQQLRLQYGRDPSYEEATWPWLSPSRREAYNRKRVANGQQPLPPPDIDLYVAPPPQTIKPIDMAEFEAEMRGRQARLGMMDRVLGRGSEGFRDAEKQGLLNGQQPEFDQYRAEGFSIRR